MRFDLTVPLARYVVQHAEDLIFPFRRYQIDKVWRGERSQRGRFREFYQCDIDIVGRGTLDSIHDAEIPCVINSTFEALHLPEFRVHISNRKILVDLLKSQGHSGEFLVKALRAIDKTNRQGVEQAKEALKEEGVSSAQTISMITDLIQCKTVDEAKEMLIKFNAPTTGVEELGQLLINAQALGMPEDRIVPDFTIARGLDYYTGTVYETFIVGNEDWGSICSGGRYDDLAGYFSTQKYPGVGVSIGLSRLFSLLVDSNYLSVHDKTKTKVLVTMQDRKTYLKDYLGIAKYLRASGIPTEIYLNPHPLREQIGYASSKNIPFAIIAGGNEFDHDRVVVKDLEHHAEETIPGDSMTEYIKRKLEERKIIV